jgi:hypothetical protein
MKEGTMENKEAKRRYDSLWDHKFTISTALIILLLLYSSLVEPIFNKNSISGPLSFIAALIAGVGIILSMGYAFLFEMPRSGNTFVRLIGMIARLLAIGFLVVGAIGYILGDWRRYTG